MKSSLIAILALWLALVAGPTYAQTIPSSTFSGLPGSPAPGQLHWVTDGACTPIPGTPEIGGGVNTDLVSYDATQTRWEFVSRAPLGTTDSDLPTFLAGSRISFDPSASGAAADDVQEALDELFAGGGAGGGGGGGATNLSPVLAPSQFTIQSDTGADAVVPAATTTNAGAMASSDRKKVDGAFDQVLILDDPATACAVWSNAMKTYADGTAPDGDYQVRVVYKLTGSNAIVPQTHFYKDAGGQWPYRACFMLHPQLAGAYIGSFPDSLGRVTANAAAVNWDSGIRLTVYHEGKIEIDETALSEDSVLWEIGNNYMAGCLDTVGADGKCDSSFFGTIAGGVRFRGDVDVRIKTKNDSGWTGEGTFSMSQTERFSAEVENDLVLLATNTASYANLGDFTIHYQGMDHSDVVWHSVGSSGITPPQLDGVVGNDGYGLIAYGPENWSAPSKLLNLRNLDTAVVFGDRVNGGKIVQYASCDAGAGVANGVCGGQAYATDGVILDGAMLEGPSYSSIVISDLGYQNELSHVYLETGATARHSVALGPYFCDGTSGTSPKPAGTVVKELTDCAASGGAGAIAFDANTQGRLKISSSSWGAGQIGGSTLLLGPGCESPDIVTIDGTTTMQATVAGHATPGEELVVSSAIASAGGCRIDAALPPGNPPFTNYYALTESYFLKTKTPAFKVDLAANIGAPNGSGLVNWSQLVGMPAGFADGSDDGSAGGATDLNGLTDVTLATPLVGATLVWNGTQWVNGPLDLASANARTGILPDANVSDSITAANYLPLAGGSLTGPVSMITGASIQVFGASSIVPIGGVVQANQVVGSGSASTAVDLATPEVSGTLGVANGGTGVSSLTSGGIVLGTGALGLHATPVLTSGQIMIGDGTTDPTIAALSGDATMTSAGVVSLAAGSVDANELVSTGVSPGTYQNANVTVDQDGRVTAIAAGSSVLIASGTKALSTTSIAAGGCNTDTVVASGVLSTDVVGWNPNADLSTVVGFRPISGDGLVIYPPVPSANLITIKTCNPTASPIPPGAVSLNFRVVR